MLRMIFLCLLAGTLCSCNADKGAGASSSGATSPGKGASSLEPSSQKMTPAPMTLRSSAFGNGDSIPEKYTCTGADISPPLSWSAPPGGAVSLALIVQDPDAPGGTFTHWVLFALNPSTRMLFEGASPSGAVPKGAVEGTNDFGKTGYGGPCPPSGTHRYFFRVYALDAAVTGGQSLIGKQLFKAMQGHVLAVGELMGRYRKP